MIAALGDSISAALVARVSPEEDFDQYMRPNEIVTYGSEDQKPLAGMFFTSTGANHETILTHSANRFSIWQEYRGLSYSTGLDPGAISLASILSHYTNLTGGSTGSHLPATCPAAACGLRERDGLNAAVSGSVARGLRAQVDGE